MSLSKLVYLVHEMSAGEGWERGRAGGSSHSLQPLSPWRQHKDILFCFASFPILSKGMKVGGGGRWGTEKRRAEEHKRGEWDFGMLRVNRGVDFNESLEGVCGTFALTNILPQP